MVHDFVDGAVSGEAGLAALSPADGCKAFSIASFFDILYSSQNSCKNFGSFHVKNGCRGGKGIKKRTLKVHPQGLESEGAFARIALF